MNKNRYSYFDGGSLPNFNNIYTLNLMIRTSIFLILMLLMLMPNRSLVAATKYETAYACEGKTLTLECEPGDLISLIRANYGRFSITICNDHGNVEWSVNCRSSKSLRVLNLKCAHKQNCSVLASTNMFGDPCPGTHKYLEAHYQCTSATSTLTTTNRPAPSWLITQQPPPSVYNTWTTTATTTAITIPSGSGSGSVVPTNNQFLVNGYNGNNTNNLKSIINVIGVPSLLSPSSPLSSSPSSPALSSIPKLPSGDGNSEIHLAGRPPNGVHRGFSQNNADVGKTNGNNPTVTSTIKSTTAINKQILYNMDINHILGNHSYNINNNSYNTNNNFNNDDINKTSITIQSKELVNNSSINNNSDNIKNYDNSDDTSSNNIGSNSYCGPTTSRNLFWNRTRVGDVNVQQCPDGTNGIAKWRCIVMPRSALNHNLQYNLNSFINRNSYINKKFNYINNQDDSEYISSSSSSSNGNNNNGNSSSDNGGLIDIDCDNNNNNNNDNNNNNNNDNNNNNNDNIDNNNKNNNNKSNNNNYSHNNNYSNNNNSNNNNNSSNCDKVKNTIKLINGINNNNSINSINNDNKDYLPIWHPQTPDLTQCRSVWFSNLENDVNKRDSSLVSIANDLSTVTSSKVLYGGDMLVTTKIIQTMSEKMPYDIETFPDQRQREAIISELLTGVVKIGSNLLDKSQQPSWLDLSHEDQMRVATSLLTGLESNAFLLADSITREKTATYPTKNILLSVRVLDSKNLPINEIFPNDKNTEHWDISQDRIELPRGALYENSDGGLVRIIFVAFDRLESILRPSYENLDFTIPRNNVQKSTQASDTTQNIVQRVRILNSKVISASLGKGRHIQLSQPIKLVLKHLKIENVTNPTCVFWNYIDHAWSSDGCYLESTNRTHSICMCNHLTNFAILMDVKEEHNKSLLSIFDNNLGIFIYISITICIIFIIIAILTLKLFNGAFIKSTRTSIYKNIYVCLFIIEILSLIGVKQNETSLLCGFTTAFLHCFILSAIAWLFFEGFQLYITLTSDDMLLEVENSSKIIWYYLLSYGLSFTIVAISLAIDPGTYTQSDFCVLMEANGLFYSTFMTPVVIFVVGAITCTSLACYDMCRKNRSPIKNKEHTRLSTVRFDLRCSLLFLIILSADWIFAYLYLRRAKQDELIAFTYGYLFVIFNSILGIYIFIFHCIQNEKIRREYRKYIRQNSWLPKCLRCSKTSSITSSASQHHHHLNQSQLQQQHQLHHQQQLTNQINHGSGSSGGSGGGGIVGHLYETTCGTATSGIHQKSPTIIANNNLDNNGCNNKENFVTTSSGGGGNGISDNVILTSVSTPIGRKYISSNDSYTNEINDCLQIVGDISGSNNISGIGIVNAPCISTLQRNSSGITSGSMQVGNTIIRTSSGGHTSPTSSIGSGHLMFNSKHLQHQPQQQQQSNEGWNYSLRQPNTIIGDNNKNLNIYDDKFLFYDCKSKRLKNHHPAATTPRNLSQQQNKKILSQIGSTGINVSGIGDIPNIGGIGSSSSSPHHNDNFPYQQHEYFYWAEKNLSGHGQSNNRNKQLNNSGDINKGHNSHPSYKITRQYSQQQQYYPTTGSGGRIYNKLNDCDFQLENDSNCPEDSTGGNSYNSDSAGGCGAIIGVNSNSALITSGGNKYYEGGGVGVYNRYPNSTSYSSSKHQLSSDEDHCGGNDSISSHHQLMQHSNSIGGGVCGNTINNSGTIMIGTNSNNIIGRSSSILSSSIGNKFQQSSNPPILGVVGNVNSIGKSYHLHHHHHHPHYDTNKHSNCDLINEFDYSQKNLVSGIGNSGLDVYYNHHNSIGGDTIDEPVYEEILNNRISDRMSNHDDPNISCILGNDNNKKGHQRRVNRKSNNDHHDDVDPDNNGENYEEDEDDAVDDDDDDDDEEDDNDDDDDDEEDEEEEEGDDNDDDRLVPKKFKQHSSGIAGGSNNGIVGSVCINRSITRKAKSSGIKENDNNQYIDDDDEEQEEDCIMNEQQYNRLRRILAKKESEEKERRQGYNRSNSINNENDILHGNLFNYINKNPSPVSIGILDDSIIIDNSTAIESQRTQEQQQLQQQPPQEQEQQSQKHEQQQPSLEQQIVIGRNISAMLDDNNTVRCYLEPLQ